MQLNSVWPAVLLFSSKPRPVPLGPPAFSNETQFLTMCGVATKFPPSLKPFPLPSNDPENQTSTPLSHAQQFSMTTVELAIQRSQPSSELVQERQPLKTFPGPISHLALKPSALP